MSGVAMSRGTQRVLSVVAAVLLVGCAQAPKPLYQWGTYPRQVYDYMKADGVSPEEQMQALAAQAQRVVASGGVLPPGYRAHMAVVLLKLGRDAEARQQIEAEKAAFPESAPYMDFLLKRMSAPKT